MTNLLEETKRRMAEYSKTVDDIIYIGTPALNRACTWEQFEKIADCDYYSGFGIAVIHEDLTIIFKDGTWFERAEYDGSEWWEYKRAPNIPQNPEPLESVFYGDD